MERPWLHDCRFVSSTSFSNHKHIIEIIITWDVLRTLRPIRLYIWKRSNIKNYSSLVTPTMKYTEVVQFMPQSIIDDKTFMSKLFSWFVLARNACKGKYMYFHSKADYKTCRSLKKLIPMKTWDSWLYISPVTQLHTSSIKLLLCNNILNLYYQ